MPHMMSPTPYSAVSPLRFAGAPQPEKASEKAEPVTEEEREYGEFERPSRLSRAVQDATQEGAPAASAESALSQIAREQALRVKTAQEKREQEKALAAIKPVIAEALEGVPKTTELAQALRADSAEKELELLKKGLQAPDKNLPYYQELLARLDEVGEALGRLDDVRRGKSPVVLTPYEKEMRAELELSEGLSTRETSGVLRRLAKSLGIAEYAPDEARRDILLAMRRSNPDLFDSLLKRAQPEDAKLVLLRDSYTRLNEAEKAELEQLELEADLATDYVPTRLEAPSGELAMHPGFEDQYDTGKKIRYTRIKDARQLISKLLDNIPWELQETRVEEGVYEVRPANDTAGDDNSYEIFFSERPEILKKGAFNRNGFRDVVEDERWQQYIFPLHEANVLAVAPEQSESPVRWFRYEKKGGRHRLYWAQTEADGRLQHYSFQWRAVRSPLTYANSGRSPEKNRVYNVLERINKMLYMYAERGMEENPNNNEYWQDKAHRKGYDELDKLNIELPEESSDKGADN